MRAGAGLGAVAVIAACVLATPCGATTRDEFWPELNAFINFDARTRSFLMAQFTRYQEPEQGASDLYRDVTLGAHVDYTLKPIGRQRAEGDWERERYVWCRAGYRYVTTLGNVANPSTEHRILGELDARFALPAEVWLDNRARLEIRDLEGTWSNRYRFRFKLERETPLFGARAEPWVSAEYYYDTRYDDWVRARYQVGVEFKLGTSWRIEPYLSTYHDEQSSIDQVNALGIKVKYYR